MIIWLSLLIPAIYSLVNAYFFHKKFVWWELGLPTVVTAVIVLIFKLSVETCLVSDTEYNNSIINKVVYYEPWETYVHKTCTRTYKCGKSTCVTTYDCSYCDHTGPKYIAYDLNSRSYSITKEHYERLVKEWNNNTFVDLKRNINYSFGCGEDGDSYESYWDETIEHSESNVFTKSYENKTKVNHTAFHYKELTEEEIKSLGLFEYPDYDFDSYKQTTLLGNFYKYTSNIKEFERKYEFLNGDLNPKIGVKVFFILFEDKGLDIAFKQECLWEGGNDNEVVVCMNIDSKTKKLTWVKPFSWCPNKRVTVELREEIMSLDTFDLNKIYDVSNTSLMSYFKPRDFKEFNYLTVEPPLFEIIITYILAILITIGVNYWCHINEFEN